LTKLFFDVILYKEVEMKSNLKIRCMFTAPEPQTGMAQGFTPVADWGWASTEDEVHEEIESVKKDLGKIEKQFNNEVKFEGWDIVRNEDEILSKSFEIQTSDIDAVLLFPCTTNISYMHAFLTLNKHLIVFNKEYLKPFYGGNLLGLHFDWDLNQSNRSRWVSIVTDSYDSLSRKIRAIRAISRLKRTKILCIGPLHQHIGGKTLRRGSYEAVRNAQEKLGLAIEFASLEEFKREIGKTEVSDEIKQVHKDFMEKAKEIDSSVKEKEALEAVKVYFAWKKMIERTNSNASTISCYQTKIIDEIDTTPCYALSKLNDEGIVTGCEADIDALVNLLIASYVADKPVYMGDPIFTEASNKMINAHCTCPLKLKGYNKENEPYVATTHYESGKGLAVQTIMEVGSEITVTMLSPDLSAIVITKGIIKKSDMRYPACRVQVEFEVKNSSEFIHQCKIHIPFIGHMINVIGDYSREIAEACRILNIEPIVV